jgi:hypothetical protein
MQRTAIASRPAIVALLLLQFIPLLLFPVSTFSLTNQEWWLPLLLCVLVLAADIALIFRRSDADWPWKLISFAQGFNIISRLMMLWPNATVQSGDAWIPDWPYIILTLISIAMSAFLLWYTDKPEVRIGLL